MEDKMLKIFMATAEEAAVAEKAGIIGPVSERGLRVAASDGYVYIQDVQLEGKKRMSVQDFLRGHRLSGTIRLS
jgi:methionyl-tRNA formyltransferase